MRHSREHRQVGDADTHSAIATPRVCEDSLEACRGVINAFILSVVLWWLVIVVFL